MPHDTVFIVDDDASVRDALSLLLSLRGHASATFASAEDFLAAAKNDWRGCAVIDIRMQGMSGLDLQARMRALGMTLPVIVITAHGDVAAARQAFLADAVDFIEKPFDGEQLLRAIEAALAATRRSAPGFDAGSQAVRTRVDDARLSPREREVFDLLVAGLHNRRIAEELGISHRTVEVHKARVLEKVGVRTVVDLVRLTDRGPPDSSS
jgi:FixJ family two-component response regulator